MPCAVENRAEVARHVREDERELIAPLENEEEFNDIIMILGRDRFQRVHLQPSLEIDVGTLSSKDFAGELVLQRQ